MVKISPSVSVAFGVGFGLDFTVGYSEGKFIAHFSGQLVFGPGGAGGVAAELNVDQVIELIQFVRQALEASDFRFLEWVTETAFDMISKIMELYLNLDKPLEFIVNMSYQTITEKMDEMSSDQQLVKNECRKILVKPERVALASPEAKARILNRICETYVFNPFSYSFDDDELQAAACIKVLESMRSEREFIEVLRLMGMDGEKGGSTTLISNFRRLFDQLLYQSEQRIKAREWLKAHSGELYLEFE